MCTLRSQIFEEVCGGLFVGELLSLCDCGKENRIVCSAVYFSAMGQRWKMVIYEDTTGHSPYAEWVRNSLNPVQLLCLNQVLSEYLFKFGNSNTKTKWLKDLSFGLYQLRVQKKDQFGRKQVLLRIYLHFYGNREILFLSGYDKRLNPSQERQQSEIEFARQLLEKWSNDE